MKQNNFLLILIFLLTTAINIHAQSVEKGFLDMPEIIIPSLNSEKRLELMEYYKEGQKDTIQNLFGKDVLILKFDTINQFLRIKTAENTQFEMKLFYTKQKKDSTSVVFGIIHTVCAPVCSSYIKFYNNEWKHLNVEIPVLKATDWMKDIKTEVDGVKISEILNSNFMEFGFSEDSNQIWIKNNSTEILTKEDKAFVKPYLTDEIKILKVSVVNNKLQISIAEK